MSPEISFGDLALYAIGGGWGSEDAEDGTTQVSVIRGTDIPRAKYGDIESFPTRYEKTSKVNKRILMPGDLVIEISGGSAAKGQTTGRSVLITEQMVSRSRLPLIPASFCRLLRLNTALIEPSFAYYALLDMYNSGRAGDYENQSTGISNFQFSVFLEREVIRVREKNEQKAIAHILGTLDDKIELNRKTNETLEAMAKALFKSWFVDFDPVRAKAEGRSTGLPAEISDLFPDSFEDSELGEIPSGWRVETVSDISSNFDSKRVPVSGNDRKKRKGEYPYYGATGIVDWIDDFLFDGTYLLIGEDGSVERSDGTAFSQYVSGKIWVNNHAHVLTGAKGIGTEHLYLYFQFIQVAPFVTGAVQLKISQGRLNSIPVVIAPPHLNDCFSGLIQNLFDQKIAIGKEISTLALLRDALLPKLISGEIRIPDAEKMLEEVGV